MNYTPKEIAALLKDRPNQPHYIAAMVRKALSAEREAMCAAIKEADEKASDNDYMLDSNDCISVIRGTWKYDA